MDAVNPGRDDGREQIRPANACTVGVLLVAVGASLCALAVIQLTSLTGAPATTNPAPPSAEVLAIPGTTVPIPTPIPELERRIMEALAKPFPDASRLPKKMAFQEAIKHVAKLLPVPVDLDSKALDDANVDTTAEVEFPAGQRAVGQVLDHILAETNSPLTWGVMNGALCVTTVDKAMEITDTRAYDVSDLVEPVVTAEGVESWDSKELIETLGVSCEELQYGSDRMSCVNASGRTILVARLGRRAHQDLVAALAKIRQLADRGSQPTRSPRRRVVQTLKAQATPRRVASTSIAALQALLSPVSDSTATTTNSTCNTFALDLYRQVRRRNAGNTAVCPFGLYVVLALLNEAASGETQRQIAHVLHTDQNGVDLQRVLPGVTNRLEAINLVPDYELSVASRAWCDEAIPVAKDFGAALRDRYHVEIDTVPFLSRPGDAQSLINDWVKHATDGRVTEIIDAADIVSGKIDFAITNAVAFRGLWADPFDRKRTLRAPFHAGGKAFDVIMMRGDKEKAPLGESAGLQILERPYRGSLLSALILLPPDAPGALERLEASLSVEKLKEYKSAMHDCQVKVELPRFEIESDFHLEEPLKALGMTRAFVPTADFSKLGRSEWRLAYLRQKTLLKVNEEGTEAAAASMAGGGFGAAQEHLFRADRPFLFLIEEKSTGLILFVARVTDPERPPY